MNGAQGPAGPKGPQGAPADAALSWIQPGSLFAARSALVEIAGSGTHFGMATRVDFGDPQVTAQGVVVASAGLLQVKVTASAAARLGAYDVTVTTPGAGVGGADEQATLKGAFSVNPSLRADVTGNSAMAPQGGVVEYSARNVDTDNPLTGNGRLGAGARALHISLWANRLFGTGLVDALAAPGPLPLSVTAGISGPGLGYALDPADINAPRVVARAPAVLTIGQDRMGEQIAAPEQTAFYKVNSIADAQVLMLTALTSGLLSSGVLCGALADQTGQFSSGQFLYASTNQATQTMVGFLPKAGDYYVSLLPSNLAGGGGNYGFTLQPRAATAKSFSTLEKVSDSPASPLATVTLDTPLYSNSGAFDTPGDLDYVLIKTPKAGRLYVSVSIDGLHLSNPATSVAIFQADCKTIVAAPEPVQQEAAAAAGGTLCARLSTPAGAAVPYLLIITQGL